LIIILSSDCGFVQYVHQLTLTQKRIKKLFDIHKENEYVGITYSEYTFEIDFYRINKKILKKFIVDNEIYKNVKVINEFDEEGNIFYSRISKLCDKLGKGWLAYRFIQWLNIKTENVKDLVIPGYIHEAIAFNVSHIFKEKSVDVFIDMLGQYKKSIGNTNDDFIKFLMEKNNG